MIDERTVSVGTSRLTRFFEGRIVDDELGRAVFDEALTWTLEQPPDPEATKERNCNTIRGPRCRTRNPQQCPTQTPDPNCCETADSSPHCCAAKPESADSNRRAERPARLLLV